MWSVKFRVEASPAKVLRYSPVLRGVQSKKKYDEDFVPCLPCCFNGIFSDTLTKCPRLLQERMSSKCANLGKFNLQEREPGVNMWTFCIFSALNHVAHIIHRVVPLMRRRGHLNLEV